MAISVDAVSTAQSGVVNTQTSQHTVSGTDRFLVVETVFFSSGQINVNDVSYNGVPLSLIGKRDNSDLTFVEMWGLIAPDTGTHDVVINFDGFVNGLSTGKISFNGVHQTTAFGAFASAIGTDAAPSVNVSSAPGELVLDTVNGAAGSATTVTADGSQVQRWNIDATGGSTEPGAASVTMSWTLDFADAWVIGGVSVKPSAAAQVVPRRRMNIRGRSDYIARIN